MARNDGIDRTCARNKPVKGNGIGRIEGHNERLNESYTNPDIVRERSPMNVHFKEPTGSYEEMFRQMEAAGEISTRGLKPDADHFGEMVFDVNSAYFHNHGGYEYAKQFFAEAYKAAVEIVGDEKYILSAVMHADERNVGMSEKLGYSIWHYHLHVAYIPVVDKEIKWSKRCKDPNLVGKVKQVIHQVSHSKKWKSEPLLDEHGKPVRGKNGKIILKKSYSVLQDKFYEHMVAAGYTDIQRGERGSDEQHLTTIQFKAMKEEQRLVEIEAQEMAAQAEAERAEAESRQAEAAAQKAQAKLVQVTAEIKDAEAYAKKLGDP